MTQFNRRQFLTIAASACGTLLIPRLAWPRGLAAGTESEPHFFIQILLDGGADCSYLFDARPLAMTRAGKIQNYIGSEPAPVIGSNGGTCYRTHLTDSLMSQFNRFSIINGAVMTPSFDGHGQNMNFHFTGSPFGGESFLPHLNRNIPGQNPLPLDGVLNGTIFLDASNHGGFVPLAPKALALLKDKLGAIPGDRSHDELSTFVRSRLEANSAGNGRFSQGARQMLEGFDGSFTLRDKILALDPPDAAQSQEKQFVNMLGSIFRQGMARNALWALGGGISFDTHSPDQAKDQPRIFGDIAGKLSTILSTLAETAFDDKRSLLDVTTVLVNSEFSRTMRQTEAAIDKTGTDHNSLNNSFLIAGKGIRTGQVLGASDFQEADETLSKSHLAFDKEKIKFMGRPFDFGTMMPSPTLPETFDPAHYLTAANVVNTIYSVFGAPKSIFRTVDRAGTIAPSLTSLLK